MDERIKKFLEWKNNNRMEHDDSDFVTVLNNLFVNPHLDLGNEATYTVSRGLGHPEILRGKIVHIAKNSETVFTEFNIAHEGDDLMYWVRDESGVTRAGTSAFVTKGHAPKQSWEK